MKNLGACQNTLILLYWYSLNYLYVELMWFMTIKFFISLSNGIIIRVTKIFRTLNLKLYKMKKTSNFKNIYCYLNDILQCNFNEVLIVGMVIIIITRLRQKWQREIMACMNLGQRLLYISIWFQWNISKNQKRRDPHVLSGNEYIYPSRVP